MAFSNKFSTIIFKKAGYDKIQTFFDVELKAATLKKRSELKVNDGTAYSFEGKDGAELSYVYSDSGLMKFLCIFFGHRVEWSKNSAIKVYSSKQEETLKLGRRFVQSIEGLDPAHKARLIDLLKG